jgi:hypothetical protein
MVMVPGLILRDRRINGLPVNCSGEDDKGQRTALGHGL